MGTEVTRIDFQGRAPPATGPRACRKGWPGLWLVSLVVLVSAALFVYINHLETQSAMREALANEGAQQEVIFALNLRNQGRHLQQFVSYLADQPEVRTLFLAGREAVAEEGGGAGGPRAAAIREALYRQVMPAWHQGRGEYRMRNLHFHLGPGDVSFLRVHEPSRFGDDLSDIRHTVVDAIRNNRSVQGYESGRAYAGVRGIAPITRQTIDGGEVVGALEAGSDFDHILGTMDGETRASYAMLLTEDYLATTRWRALNERLEADNPLQHGLYIEGASDPLSVRHLLGQSEVREALGGRRPVISWFAGYPYAVYSFPFRDYRGTVDLGQEPVGMILTWRDASDVLAQTERSLRDNIMFGIFGFLVIETLLISAWSLVRRRLQTVIDGQTRELSETNRTLSGEIERRVESEQRLRDIQVHLEDTVERRTGSLRDTVDALKREMDYRQAAEVRLQHERDQAKITLHSIADGVITTDARGMVSYLNPAAETLTGWDIASAMRQPLSEVFHARDLQHGGRPFGYTGCLAGHCEHAHGENTELRRRDGLTVLVQHSVAPIRGIDGTIQGLVLIFHDDTEARRLARQLSYQATHDALTGLKNRRAIDGELKELLERAHDSDDLHAFVYIDLDQFKVVNDTSGHIAGDELLRQLGRMLQRKIRQSDSLGRLGGDEFGLLLRNCAPDKAREIAEGLRTAIRAFRFVWKDRTFQIGASLGIAMFDRHTESVEAIFTLADSACFMAKEKGRGRVQLALPGDKAVATRLGEMDWVTRIHQALADDRLVLFGQPIVGLSNDLSEPGHLEVLVRMIDEHGELIPPNAFIPAAERYGVMPDVDRWIIRRTFRLMSERRRDGEAKTVYGINLSGETMTDDAILGFIEAEMARFEIDPGCICFEITETAAIANLVAAIELMTALKRFGCRFALDDFGSGLSSFGYLKTLPVDYLKIDGEFVRRLDTDAVDRVMVQAINSVGHAMQLKTIAEFVENDGVLRLLTGFGVDYAQGYGVGRPAPLEPL
jgi:diguanylate cyclase (GGDEF)-like protein/PAS domain S-box-containing protein